MNFEKQQFSKQTPHQMQLNIHPQPHQTNNRLQHLQKPDKNYIQRCFATLMDINQLKSSFQELKQHTVKQFQTLRSALQMIVLIQQNPLKQINLKNSHTNNGDNTTKVSKTTQTEQKNQEILQKVSEYENQITSVKLFASKQTQKIKELKVNHKKQIQNLNLKINELYSIIYSKSNIIQKMAQKNDKNKNIWSSAIVDENKLQKRQRSNSQSMILNRIRTLSCLAKSQQQEPEHLKNMRASAMHPKKSNQKQIFRSPLRKINFPTQITLVENIGSQSAFCTKSKPKQRQEVFLSRTKQNGLTQRSSESRVQKNKTSGLEQMFQRTLKIYRRPSRLFG